MKAMILAAGKGTRLGDITRTTPKILIDIGGITLLEWLVGKLSYYGFKDIIINVHHLADMVETAGFEIGKKLNVNISFSNERSELLDTGGGLYKARTFFGDSPFLLYNGDIVTDLDLGALYRLNLFSAAIATLALKNRPGKRFFLTDENGILIGWVNRETGEEILVKKQPDRVDEIAFSAISVINPDIFRFMDEGVYSMRPVYLDVARESIVNSLTHDKDFWIDIGSEQQLEKCRSLFLENYDPIRFF